MVLFVTIKSSIELTLGELSLSCMVALLTLTLELSVRK